MKIIDAGGSKSTSGKLDSLNRSLGSLLPSQVRETSQAQETAVALLQNILDNRFILVRGVRLRSDDGLPPLILVGPPGIWVIEISALHGIFRSSGDSWEMMDSKTHAFRSARPNLPRQTAATAKMVEAFLVDAGETPVKVDAVVLFTHPGAHLELQHPAVRLIQADAIGRFAAGLLKAPIILEKEAILSLSERLGQTPGDLALEDVDELAEFGDLDAAQSNSLHLPAIPEEEPDLVKRVSRFASFNRYQWFVLALLLVLNIFVLVAVILILVMIT